ncbi:hypothetical protein ACW9HQ_48045, partial [Nocardia gipuzkoensis]
MSDGATRSDDPFMMFCSDECDVPVVVSAAVRRVIVAAAMLVAGAVIASSCASTHPNPLSEQPTYPAFLSAAD